MENLSRSSVEPIRVLFLIDSFRMGGAEKITASFLPEFDRKIISPFVCVLNQKDECTVFTKSIENSNIVLHDLQVKRLLDPRAVSRLCAILKQHDIKIIHAQLQDSNILAAVVSKMTGIPAITTRHLIDDPEPSFKWKLRNMLERFITRKYISHLVGVSEAALTRYQDLARFPAVKSSVIYNGIDEGAFRKRCCNGRGLKEELDLDQDVSLVVMVGVLREGKGQLTAIRAMEQVKHAHLLIVGDGDPDLKDAVIRSCASCERIHYLGQRSDIPEILGQCEVLILPSEYEALPTVIIEAGCAGLPSIVSDVGGCGEIIEHGVNGYLISPGDPSSLAFFIDELVKDKALAKLMGENAYKNVQEKFTISRQVAALTSLYLRLREE